MQNPVLLTKGRVMRRSDVQETELETIVNASEGDREAFGRLYERYVYRVFRHIYSLTNDSKLAEDLTAQTFLNALEAILRYEVRGVPFLAWLFRIAYNLSMSQMKAQNKQNGRAQLAEGVEAKGTSHSPAESCEAKVDGEQVWEEVRKLTGDQRQVIVMRFIDGLSYADIARVLDKSVGATRVIQYRALVSLRRMLEDDLAHYYLKSRAG